MEEQTRGGSTVPVVGILAIFALVLLAAWVFIIRDGRTGAQEPVAPAPQAAPAPKSDSNNDVEIKVDLPDSITIKP